MSEPVNPTTFDRLLASLRAIIRAEFPQFTYVGIYEYSIQSTDGSTVSCDPTDHTIPLPSLSKVPIRSGVAGESVSLPASVVGNRCLIAFVNADPSRPVCIGMDAIPGALPAARMTDPVVAGPFGGTITLGSSNIRIG